MREKVLQTLLLLSHVFLKVISMMNECPWQSIKMSAEIRAGHHHVVTSLLVFNNLGNCTYNQKT